MAKKNSQTLPKEVTQKLAENWQRCRQENLPALFYAYDEKESQGERIVTFRLDRDKLQELYDDVTDQGSLQFIVHLGMTDESIPEQIPDIPPFVLLLQASEKKTDFQANCFLLNWAPNGRFTTYEESDPTSGENAIPAASAYLFVMSWMETAEEDLAMPFTAGSHVLGKRVKNYRFSNAESISIYKDIKATLKSDLPRLDIHMGNGLAVYDHPFSFRPVIEVRNAVNVDENGSLVEPTTNGRSATGLVNGYGDSFYDFGAPEPPPQPEG
jgi:hypothetical protein